MLFPRLIPTLLLFGNGFYKTTRFKKPVYLGDPLNILKIFNAKEVDEVLILDVLCSAEQREPNFNLLKEIASECFMPLAYGGGVNGLKQMEKIFFTGYEKVLLNLSAYRNPNLVREAARVFGSQSIVVGIDVKKSFFRNNYRVYVARGSKSTGESPVDYARRVEDLGAGEIMIQSIDKDGTMSGFDIELIREVSSAVKIPVIASGGAASAADLVSAIKVGGASAAAAGSLFVFHGKEKGVLINVPLNPEQLIQAIGKSGR